MFSPTHWFRVGLLALLACGAPPSARAMNYSVPYVRENLPYAELTFGDTWGFGSTIGLLEVQVYDTNNVAENGISVYSNSPERGLQSFVNVQNFAAGIPSADDYAHGTLVAHVLDNLFTYSLTAKTNIPYSQITATNGSYPIIPWSIGMAPRAAYHGALFDGRDTKAGLLSLNTSLHYLTATGQVQAINNSWGATVSSAAELNGLSPDALLLDEYAGYYGKTNGTAGAYRDVLMVVAAGNEGSLLTTPADAYNGLTVGALDNGNTNTYYIDEPTRVPLPRVADFSSKLPLADGRCGVSVVAPGTWVAIVDRITVGTNSSGEVVIDSLTGVLGDGTSFAAPHVTGEAAILYGAPNHPLDPSETSVLVSSATTKNTPFSTDHKLVKALIINSADKIEGCDSNGVAQSTWQPGLITSVGGVTNSIHPLNYAVGSGQANADEAYLGYYEVSNRFWDVNMVTNGQTNAYTYGEGKFSTTDSNQPSLRLTATLVWDRHVDFTVNTDTNSSLIGTLANETNLLSNLDLILQQEIAPDVWTDLYRSLSTVDNVEQIYLNGISAASHYRLNVIANNLVDPVGGEHYALAVSFLPIPEPSTLGLTGIALLGVLARRRRQQRDSADEAPAAPTRRGRRIGRSPMAWQSTTDSAEAPAHIPARLQMAKDCSACVDVPHRPVAPAWGVRRSRRAMSGSLSA